VQSGADPKVTVNNTFGAGYGPSRKPQEMSITMPLICSYGFVDGDRRGLVLVSQDTRNSQEVEIRFAGQPANGLAKMWLLANDNLEANNEPDWSPDRPQVKLEERTIKDFASGHRVTLPKASMLVLEWK